MNNGWSTEFDIEFPFKIQNSVRVNFKMVLKQTKNSYYFLATVMCEFVSNVESETVYFLENFVCYLLFRSPLFTMEFRHSTHTVHLSVYTVCIYRLAYNKNIQLYKTLSAMLADGTKPVMQTLLKAKEISLI